MAASRETPLSVIERAYSSIIASEEKNNNSEYKDYSRKLLGFGKSVLRAPGNEAVIDALFSYLRNEGELAFIIRLCPTHLYERDKDTLFKLIIILTSYFRENKEMRIIPSLCADEFYELLPADCKTFFPTIVTSPHLWDLMLTLSNSSFLKNLGWITKKYLEKMILLKNCRQFIDRLDDTRFSPCKHITLEDLFDIMHSIFLHIESNALLSSSFIKNMNILELGSIRLSQLQFILEQMKNGNYKLVEFFKLISRINRFFYSSEIEKTLCDRLINLHPDHVEALFKVPLHVDFFNSQTYSQYSDPFFHFILNPENVRYFPFMLDCSELVSKLYKGQLGKVNDCAVTFNLVMGAIQKMGNDPHVIFFLEALNILIAYINPSKNAEVDSLTQQAEKRQKSILLLREMISHPQDALEILRKNEILFHKNVGKYPDLDTSSYIERSIQKTKQIPKTHYSRFLDECSIKKRLPDMLVDLRDVYEWVTSTRAVRSWVPDDKQGISGLPEVLIPVICDYLPTPSTNPEINKAILNHFGLFGGSVSSASEGKEEKKEEKEEKLTRGSWGESTSCNPSSTASTIRVADPCSQTGIVYLPIPSRASPP